MLIFRFLLDDSDLYTFMMLPHMNHQDLNLLQYQLMLQQIPKLTQSDYINAYSNYLHQQQQLQEQLILQCFQQQKQSQDLLNFYQQALLAAKEPQGVVYPKVESAQESPQSDPGFLKKRKATPEAESESKRPCSSSSTLATPIISGSSTPRKF